MSEEDSNGIDRRNVLQNIAAGTAAVAGGTGIASAAGTSTVRESVSDEYVEQYGDFGTVYGLIAERQGALDTLVENGYLDEASVDALGFEQVAAGRPQDVSEGTATVTEHVTADGTVAAIHVPVESSQGRARLTVVPEQDHAFAALPAGEGGDMFRDVETSDIQCGVQTCDCCQCRNYPFHHCWCC